MVDLYFLKINGANKVSYFLPMKQLWNSNDLIILILFKMNFV